MSKFKGFSSVKLTRPTRSTFDLSHDKRLSTRMGRLTPVLVTECVPSDMFYGSSEILLRLAPLLAPIYDQIHLFVHYFFVPNRLLWEDWEEFITGGRLGVGIDPVTAPVPPKAEIFNMLSFDPLLFSPSQLSDYLGVPVLPMVGSSAADYNTKYLDLMPALAYQCIVRDYYRDRNFVADSAFDFLPAPSGINTDDAELAQIWARWTRNYLHDYFTSSLPFTQRGEEVLIPIDGTVTYLEQSRIVRSDTDLEITNQAGLLTTQDVPDVGPGSMSFNGNRADLGPGVPVRVENIDGITNANTTMNDFRAAYALQVWLERNAIGGSRYTESTEAHFGVKPQDSRLQRAEYIGGGRIPVRISEVVSTAYAVNADDDSVPQANMAGHGITYGNTNSFKYFCTEHGFIMGIASIMNPPSYHQGLPKMFRRGSFLDYPWPTFAKLGEQQVDKAEIFASHENLTPDELTGELPLFGYQSRYADWKYIPNWNHGAFHDTLLFWTLTRDFVTSPELGAEFNSFADGTQDRIFAVADTQQDNFWLYCHNKLMVKRPLPYFGTPNTLGFV